MSLQLPAVNRLRGLVVQSENDVWPSLSRLVDRLERPTPSTPPAVLRSYWPTAATLRVFMILNNMLGANQSASFRDRGVPVVCCVLVTNSPQNTLQIRTANPKTLCAPLTYRSCALYQKLEPQVAFLGHWHFGQPGTPGTLVCRGKIKARRKYLPSSISLTHLGLDSLLDYKLQTYELILLSFFHSGYQIAWYACCLLLY